MPAELKRGMDHDLYAFSPIGERPALSWPGGAPVALWVVLYLDYWELSTPKDFHRAPDTQGMWGTCFPICAPGPIDFTAKGSVSSGYSTFSPGTASARRSPQALKSAGVIRNW